MDKTLEKKKIAIFYKYREWADRMMNEMGDHCIKEKIIELKDKVCFFFPLSDYVMNFATQPTDFSEIYFQEKAREDYVRYVERLNKGTPAKVIKNYFEYSRDEGLSVEKYYDLHSKDKRYFG